MKRSLKILLSILLIINLIVPVYAEDLKTQKEPETIVVEIDGQEVELSPEEYKEYQKKIAEEIFKEQVKKEEPKTMEQLTTSYLLGDFKSRKILKEHNIDEMVAIASTTKILTVYVVMDQIKSGKISKDDIVSIDRETTFLKGSTQDLKEGEEISVWDLVKGAMVVSGNDSTRALAKYIAGDEETFVQMMRDKLDSLGITEYEIINPSGLPDYLIEKQNMMTTRDLFTLSCAFIEDYPEILNITSLEEIIDTKREYEKENTNPILKEVRGIDGLKTGYTGMAGRCMVATGRRAKKTEDTSDIRLVGITMGSRNDAQRYVAIKRLMEEGLDNYIRKTTFNSHEVIEYIQGNKTIPENIPLYIQKPEAIVMKKDQNLTWEINTINITPPMNIGDVVGEIVYYLEGEEVYRTGLILHDNIREASTKGWLMRFYEEGFRNLQIIIGK